MGHDDFVELLALRLVDRRGAPAGNAGRLVTVLDGGIEGSSRRLVVFVGAQPSEQLQAGRQVDSQPVRRVLKHLADGSAPRRDVRRVVQGLQSVKERPDPPPVPAIQVVRS
jgi:hypothetical protein